MATGNFLQDKGYDAAAAITKFRAVKFSGPETVTPVTAVTDVVIGIEQFGVSSAEIAKGKGASVRRMGASEMEANDTLAEGDLVAIDNVGRAVAAATGSRVIGVCDEGGDAGDRIRVTLDLPGTLAP